MRPRVTNHKSGRHVWKFPCGRGPVAVLSVAVVAAAIAAVGGADPGQVGEDDVGLDDGAVRGAQLHRVVRNLLQVDHLEKITIHLELFPAIISRMLREFGLSWSIQNNSIH